MSPQSRCALLGLPGEIRAMVLQQLLIPESRHLRFNTSFQWNENLCLQILRTCRQLLNEGLPLLYGGSVIEANLSPANHDRIFHSINQSCISMIRRLSLPADNYIYELEESRDLVQGAKNLRLAALLQNYSSQLAGLQMLRLEFEEIYISPWPQCNLYFEHLKLWDEFEQPETKGERIFELRNMVQDFGFHWTVLRAQQSVCETRSNLAGHVYECLDHMEEICWIVFTKAPLRSANEASLEVGIEYISVTIFK
jgi:hypothetical protein